MSQHQQAAELSDSEDASSLATLKYQSKKLEREEVQKRTFLRWINSQLSRTGKKTILSENFVEEIKDGTLLLTLIKILTGVYVKPEIGVMKVHHLNNVNQAIRFLEKQYNIKLVNICSDDIVNGNIKLILGLLWTLILHWQVNDVLKVNISDKPQSNLEKTLLEWCRTSTKGYPKLNIANFSSSFNDGLAFCALFHHFSPLDFYFEDLLAANNIDRLKFAFDFAEQKFGIEKIIEPDDIAIDQPDKKSILIYIICCYQILNQKSPIKHPHSAMGYVERTRTPKILATEDARKENLEGSWKKTKFDEEEMSYGQKIVADHIEDVVPKFQNSMELVLVWLLEAKETINNLPAISNYVQIVKDQFQEHEDFMVKLTERQADIGSMMQRGNEILSDSSVAITDQKQVEAQMLLLNKEWEELRIEAMNRQTKLQQALTNLQQNQLNELEGWLEKMEAIIDKNMGRNHHCENIENEIKLHKMLQDEVESQQHQVNGLQNMVVVVDENNGDESIYSALEKQLEDLGHRWGKVCRWVEGRWIILQNILHKLKLFDEKKERFSSWLIRANSGLDACGNNLEQMQAVAKQIQLLKSLELNVDQYMLEFDQLNLIGSELEVNLTDDPKTIHNINDQLHELKNRWDATMCRMEDASKKIVDSGVVIEEMRQPDGNVLLTIKKNSYVTTVTVVDDSSRINLGATAAATTTTSAQNATIDNDGCRNGVKSLPTEESLITGEGNVIVATTCANTNSNIRSCSYTVNDNKTTAPISSVATGSNIGITEVTTTTTILSASKQAESNVTSATVAVTEVTIPKEATTPVTSKEKLEFLAGYMAVETLAYGGGVGEKSCAKNIDALPEAEKSGKEVLADFEVEKARENVNVARGEGAGNEVTGNFGGKKIEVMYGEVGSEVEERERDGDGGNIEKVSVIGLPKNEFVDEDDKRKKWRISLDELRSFLRSARADVPREEVHRYGDISKKKDDFKNYKAKLDQKFCVYDDIVNYTNNHAIDQSDESKFKMVKVDWLKSNEEAELEIEKLDELSASINKFNNLLREETRWQDQMERLLNKKFKPSGDAEDLAEELDEFENRISDLKSANGVQFEAISRSISLHGPIGKSMENDRVQCRQKTESILQQARTRMARLEEGIAAAQQREGQIVELQQWILDVHDTLQHHIDADLLAGDLPDEYQILSDEFSHQEDFLASLEADVSRFRRDGMEDAADRLHQQITLLKHQFEDVTFKFVKFQKPTDFDSKFNFVKRELDEVDEAIQLMEMGGTDTAEIQAQFDSYIKFYKRMSELKGNVEEVIRTGRQVAERKQVEFPQMLNSQIDAVKGQYNKLGAQVTNGKITLEKCLRLSRKVHRETKSIGDFCDRVDDEFDKDHALKPNWIETSATEASNRRSMLKMLSDAVDQWNKLSEANGLKRPNTSVVDGAADRLRGVISRLQEAKDKSSERVIPISTTNHRPPPDAAPLSADAAAGANNRTKKAAQDNCQSDIQEIERWLLATELEFEVLGRDDYGKIESLARSVDVRRVQFDSIVHSVRTSDDANFMQMMTPKLIQLTRRFHLLSRKQQQFPLAKNLTSSPATAATTTTATTAAATDKPKELRVTTPLEKSVFQTPVEQSAAIDRNDAPRTIQGAETSGVVTVQSIKTSPVKPAADNARRTAVCDATDVDEIPIYSRVQKGEGGRRDGKGEKSMHPAEHSDSQKSPQNKDRFLMGLTNFMSVISDKAKAHPIDVTDVKEIEEALQRETTKYTELQAMKPQIDSLISKLEMMAQDPNWTSSTAHMTKEVGKSWEDALKCIDQRKHQLSSMKTDSEKFNMDLTKWNHVRTSPSNLKKEKSTDCDSALIPLLCVHG